MAGKRQKSNQKLKSIWDESLIEEILPNKRHRNKMWNWLINHANVTCGIADIPFSEWNMPKEAINRITSEFVMYTSKVSQCIKSNRGDTIKLLITLQDGYEIETVVMKHLHHATVCVSSQIGCQMGCR